MKIDIVKMTHSKVRSYYEVFEAGTSIRLGRLYGAGGGAWIVNFIDVPNGPKGARGSFEDVKELAIGLADGLG